MPVPLRSGVELRVDGDTIRVKGPKGQLTQRLIPDSSPKPFPLRGSPCLDAFSKDTPTPP